MRHKLDLSFLEIKRNSLEEINNTANANTEYEWNLLKGVYDIPLKYILPPPRHDTLYSRSDEKARIGELADKILNNGWIKAVIVQYWKGDDGPQYDLIEGQHRARAMRLLGAKDVIAQVYELV